MLLIEKSVKIGSKSSVLRHLKLSSPSNKSTHSTVENSTPGTAEQQLSNQTGQQKSGNKSNTLQSSPPLDKSTNKLRARCRRYMTLSFRSIRSSSQTSQHSFKQVTKLFTPNSSLSQQTTQTPPSSLSKTPDSSSHSHQLDHPSSATTSTSAKSDDGQQQPQSQLSTVNTLANGQKQEVQTKDNNLIERKQLSPSPKNSLSSPISSSSEVSVSSSGTDELVGTSSQQHINAVETTKERIAHNDNSIKSDVVPLIDTKTVSSKNPSPPTKPTRNTQSINSHQQNDNHTMPEPSNNKTTTSPLPIPTTISVPKSDSTKVNQELKKIIKPADIGAPLPLKNLGNTCYENSIIQCLFSLTSFMYDFKQKMQVALDYNKSLPRADVEFKIAKAFHKLYDGYLSKRLLSQDEKNRLMTNNSNHNSTSDTSICSSNGNVQTNNTSDSSTNKVDNLCTDPSVKEQSVQVDSPTSPELDLEKQLNELKTAVGEKSSQFNSTHQQDASEFFYHVIDSIQEYFQSIDSIHDEKNPITRSFELDLNTYVTCVKCGHKTSAVSEKIRTLSLTIPDDERKNSDTSVDSPNGKDSSLKNNQSTIIELTLQNALVNYFLDDLMEFKCSEANCDSKEKTRKCMIRKLPEVLFMTLARYSHTGQKNLDEIKAPFEIYVPYQQHRFVDDDQEMVPLPAQKQSVMYADDNKYQLVAVVCHLGPSLNTGHYTSFVYNQENGYWYSCDDDAVTRAETKQVEREARRSGYCFFYAHKSTIAHPQLLELSLAKNKSPSKIKNTLTNGTTTTSSTQNLANGLNNQHSLVTSQEVSQRRTKSSTSISSAASQASLSQSIESSDEDDSDSSDTSSLSSQSSSSSSSTSSQSSISLNLANLSERSASDRCMTAGCKLFGDKETNYWLCAMCFELQKQELQSYHSEREKT